MSLNVPISASLPLQGRPERQMLYRWVEGEEVYVADKFDDSRNDHDDSLMTVGVKGFWIRQITQYLDRAQIFLNEASEWPSGSKEARYLEQKAQQAICKCMMTCKGLAESSIRVFGALPAPGVSSGEIQKWD